MSDDVMWLDERHAVSLAELCEAGGCSEIEIRELVTYGAILPLEASAPAWTFSAESVLVLRRLARLRNGLEIDIAAACAMLALTRRIAELEGELRALRARLPQARG